MAGVLCLLLGVCSSTGGDDPFIVPRDSCQKNLNDLVVTWTPQTAKRPGAFAHLPRTMLDAVQQDWVPLDDGCETKSLDYHGLRFILKDDPSVLILYDGQGHIAGIQTAIPKSVADSGGVVDYTKLKYVHSEKIKGQDYYVMTFYFINPSEICRGRSARQFKAEGTMKQMYIKNGPGDSYFKPPLTENSQQLEALQWTKGRCVNTMGMHYFPNFPVDMKCPEMAPFFLVYDKDCLNGGGMFVIGNFTAQPRFEYVAKTGLPGSLATVPDCLNEVYTPQTGGITSMHFFFNSDQTEIVCPA